MINTLLSKPGRKSFESSQTVQTVLAYLHENNILNCAITQNGKVLGTLNKETLEQHPGNTKIKNISLDIACCFSERHHLFEAWFSLLELNAQCIVLLNENELYVDCIQQHELLAEIKRYLGHLTDDCILIINQRSLDFELSRIAIIAEEFNCTIKNCLTRTSKDNESLLICLHLKCSNFEKLINSFSRHDIDVDHIFCEGDQEEALQNRLNHLMNYLNV